MARVQHNSDLAGSVSGITQADFEQAQEVVSSKSKDGARYADDYLPPDPSRAAPLMPNLSPASPEALQRLQDLFKQHGTVHTVDIDVASRKLARDVASGLRALFEAAQELKSQGDLVRAEQVETITPEVAVRVARGDLPVALAHAVQKAARIDLLQTFSDPVRDADLRTLLCTELERRFKMGTTAIDDVAPAPQAPLSKLQRRQRDAVSVLLHDSKASPELRRACVKALATCGDGQTLTLLEKLAAKSTDKGLLAEIRATCDAIRSTLKLSVCFMSMEVKPFTPGGGLGNYHKEAPQAVARAGHKVTVFLPRHTDIDRTKFQDTGVRVSVQTPDGVEPAQVLKLTMDGVDYIAIENDKYFSANRHGVYRDANGDYGDAIERFDFFSKATTEAMKLLFGKMGPDVVEVGDAHCAPASAHMKDDSYFKETAVIYRPHNAEADYQQRFSSHLLGRLSHTVAKHYYPCGPLEFYNQGNYTKLGEVLSDAVIFVSEKDRQDRLNESHGAGLHGVHCKLDAQGKSFGNRHGIGPEWNPETDPLIPAHFSLADLSGKAVCKAELQKRHGLPQDPAVPVVGVVSRIDWQKGLDTTVETIRAILGRGENVQFVICGDRKTGDPNIVRELDSLTAQYPNNVRYDGNFSSEKEHQILAGSDLFFMPSKFEPCGFPQMYAMRNLTPVVGRAVQGIDESIENFEPSTGKGNGYKFTDDPVGSLSAALALFRKGGSGWQALLRGCALTDDSWDGRAVPELVSIYRHVLRRKRSNVSS